jgi:Na+/H+-dicarboxylate symporter
MAMTIPKIPLHLQILIALALGSVFGAIFNVDPYKVKIKYLDEKRYEHKQTVEHWERIEVLTRRETDMGMRIDTSTFGAEDQIQVIKFYNKLPRKKKLNSTVQVFKDGIISSEFSNVTSIKKIPTIATYIKPVGDIFIRLLSFLAIPLVIASLIVGAASLGDIKKLGRIGGKTFLIYVVTTAFAITIGLASANILQPGKKVDFESKNRLMGTFQEDSSEKLVEEMEIDIVNFFVDIVPTNPIEAMASGNMLQIVFFAVLFGVTLTFVERKYATPVLGFFNGVSETMIKMVDIIMKLAPYGVFALIAATIADFGFNILSTLVWYIFAVLIGLFLHTFVVYSTLVKTVGKTSPLKYFKAIRNAQAIGFSTSSSAATLPVTYECVEQNMGISKEISGFVLPLGATINMDGTALYQGVAAVFIAQVYGFDLGLAEQLTIVMTAVLASIGTAPVPGVGIIMLVMILQAVHVPPEGIALILGVDRILDMCRTVTNVSGDAAVTIAIAGSEKS